MQYRCTLLELWKMIYLIESRQHIRGTFNIKTWLIKGIVNQSERGKKTHLKTTDAQIPEV